MIDNRPNKPNLLIYCRRLQFVMTHNILHIFRTSASFEEKVSDHFEDLHKLELLTGFNVNLINHSWISEYCAEILS